MLNSARARTQGSSHSAQHPAWRRVGAQKDSHFCEHGPALQEAPSLTSYERNSYRCREPWGRGALSGRKLLSAQHVAPTLSEAVTLCGALAGNQEPVSCSASTTNLLCGTGQVPTLHWVMVSSSVHGHRSEATTE